MKGKIVITSIIVLVVGLSVLFSLTAVAGKSNDTLVIAHSGPIHHMDPPVDWYGSTHWILRHMYDSLVWRDPVTNDMYGQVAKSWEDLSSIHKRFYLHEDAFFQNGEPINAAAVKWNIDRLLNDPSLMVHGQWEFIDHVEVVDEYTLDVFLVEPYAWWLADIGYNGSGLVPPKYFEEVGPKGFEQNPIGSGAYKLVDYSPNNWYKLEGWEDYYGPKPAIKNITFMIIPEMTTRLAALMSGEVDIVYGVPPLDRPRLENADMKITQASAFLYQTLYVRQHSDVGKACEEYPDYEPILKDRLLRAAIDYALDRAQLAELRGGGLPARFRITHASKYALPEFYGESANIYDPEMAKRYMAEWRAKYDHPADYRPEIWLSSPQEYIANEGEVAQVIATMLEEVGFKVHLNIMGYETYREEISGKGLNRDLTLVTLGQSVSMSGLFYLCRWVEPTYRYCDPELDVIINRFRTAATEEERLKAYQEFERHWVWDRAELPLYEAYTTYAMNPNLDWSPRTDGWMVFLKASWEKENQPGGW